MVLSLAIVTVAALVLLGVLLIRPFGGGGEEAPESGGVMPEATEPSGTSEPTLVPGSGETEATAPGANMFRGNPARTGEYPGPGVGLSPALAWRFEVEDAAHSPSVANGVVYVSDGSGRLYALGAASGDELWSAPLGGHVANPAVAGDVVYVGHGESDSDTAAPPGHGYLSALAAETGREIWSLETIGAATSPLVAKDVVYAGTRASYIYAVDAEKGNVLWTFNGGGSYAHAAASNGSLYVTVFYHQDDDRGRVYALDAVTGEEQWSIRLDGGIATTPAVRGGAVYVGTGSHLYALEASTGKTLWRFELDGFGFTSAAVAGGTVFVGSGTERGTGYVHALNATTGTEMWCFEAGDAVYGSSPAYADGAVYVGSLDNYMYALDAATGVLLWRYETGDSIYSSPAVTGGTVYFGSNFGYVYAIRQGSQTGEIADEGLRAEPVSHLIQQAMAGNVQRVQVGQVDQTTVLYWLLGEDRRYQTKLERGDTIQGALGNAGIPPADWPHIWIDGNR